MFTYMYVYVYEHGNKYLDSDLVKAVSRFLQEPPGNYQGVPVFSRSQWFVQEFLTVPK